MPRTSKSEAPITAGTEPLEVSPTDRLRETMTAGR
jgi:hypothetical protein